MLQGTMLMQDWDVNPQMTVWPPENREEQPEFHNLYPDLMAGLPKDAPWLNEYGVCDTVEQFLDLAKDRLEADARTFVVTFTRIPKEPENKGEGGGWRWHEISYWLGIGEDNEASGCIAQLMEFDGISAEAIWEAAVSAGVEAPVLENVKQRLEKEEKL